MKSLKKGKRYQKKQKSNKKLIFIVSLIFAILVFGFFQIFKNNQQKEEQGEETFAEIEIQEPIVIEPSEDTTIQKLIQTEQEKYHLTDKNFAFFYYRIEDKKYYFYNQDTTFTAASTVKVPVAMLYYDKINQGEMTLDSTLVYSKGTYEAGGGTTASTYKIGQKIPISFLLKQSIINSDNTAVNILIKNIGQKQYRYEIAEYTDEKEKLPIEFYSNNLITASFAYKVIDHLYQNQTQYTQLIEDMKQSSFGEYLKKYITQYEVAHKYGSYNGYVHDYGFVLSQEPYLIGIFTKNVTNADEVIAKISLDVLNETEKIIVETDNK